MLTVLSSYGLTKYAQEIQLGFLNLDSIPVSYKVYFGLSSTFAAFTPVLVFVFLFSDDSAVSVPIVALQSVPSYHCKRYRLYRCKRYQVF